MTAPGRRPDPPSQLSPISGALREAIAARRVSAYRLARSSGVNERNIRRWLRGESDLTLSSADRLAVALGVRASEGPGRRSPRPSSARAATPLPLIASETETDQEAPGEIPAAGDDPGA